MKKPILLAGLVLGSLFIAGCNSKTPTDTTEGSSTSDKLKAWTDAVKIGGGVTCSTTNTKTNTQSTYVAKGKKLHMKGLAMGDQGTAEAGEMISDGEFLYTWDTEKKEGIKMAIPSEEELSKNPGAPKAPDFTSEDTIKNLEADGYKIDCNPGIISDAEFVPPTDVKFQDFSAMMDDVLKQTQEDKNLDEEQKKAIEDAMKQYAQ